MKLSFTTLGCPDWTIDDIIRNGKAYGFDGVELRTHTDGNHFSPDAPRKDAVAMGQRFRDGGIPVMSIMGYSTFAHLEPAKVQENVALLAKLVDVAEAFRAPFVRTFAGRIPEGANREAMVEQVAGAIKSVAARAADKGVVIGLETHDDWCSGDRVMSVARLVDSKGFGVVYDIYNSFHSGIEAWDVTYGKLRKHICYCHVKDGYPLGGGKDTYVMLGAGDLPIRDILGRFKADGFNSYFSFEWEKKWRPELEPPERVFPHYARKLRQLWDAI